MTRRPGDPGCADWPAAAGQGQPGGTPATCPPAGSIDESGLDARTHALVLLAALIADGERLAPCDGHVAAALDYGVTADEIAGVLVALRPALGAARIRDAAPEVLGAIERATEDSPARPD